MRTATDIAAAYLGGDAAKSDLIAEIDALVAAEREACAKIADRNRAAFGIMSPVGEAMSLMAGNIARQIRSRAEDKTPRARI